jgi:hypothetical protein
MLNIKSIFYQGTKVPRTPPFSPKKQKTLGSLIYLFVEKQFKDN